MLVSLQEILTMAEKGGYAIPALNVYNLETVMGVIAAAEEERSPIILQIYSRLLTNEDYSFHNKLLQYHHTYRQVCRSPHLSLWRYGWHPQMMWMLKMPL